MIHGIRSRRGKSVLLNGGTVQSTTTSSTHSTGTTSIGTCLYSNNDATTSTTITPTKDVLPMFTTTNTTTMASSSCGAICTTTHEQQQRHRRLYNNNPTLQQKLQPPPPQQQHQQQQQRRVRRRRKNHRWLDGGLLQRTTTTTIPLLLYHYFWLKCHRSNDTMSSIYIIMIITIFVVLIVCWTFTSRGGVTRRTSMYNPQHGRTANHYPSFVKIPTEMNRITSRNKEVSSINSRSTRQNFPILFQQQQSGLSRSSSKLSLPHGGVWYSTYGPDFGGIDVRIPEDVLYMPIQQQQQKQQQAQRRVIYHDYHADMGYKELLLYDETHHKNNNNMDDDHNDDVESYYAFDDDTKRNTYIEYDDPNIHQQKHCRRTNWHRELPIICNTIHELDFESKIRYDPEYTRYLSRGAYRYVFQSSSSSTPTTDSNNHNQSSLDHIVMKIIQLDSSYNYEDYEFVRMDAIVNEKLNQYTDRIVTMYAFCGITTIGEAMIYGDMEHIAIPTGIGRVITNIPINEPNLTVRNSLSGTQKLEFSLDMAEAVLLLHSYPGGVIVHDDIQPSQFLLSSTTGTLKLNDFNRAEIMLWNDKDQEYCKYRNHPGGGDWRAPEEYFDKPLDEKIDIWSLGNNMYALLTGSYPFYESTNEEVKKNVMDGLTPYIDPRYKQRSFAESKLVEIIPQCYVYDPNQRIDIFQLVYLLRTAVQENRVINR